ncbi:MAG: hypothetical protein JXA93_07775 [Anaerolineae bacterium]|nr:hypothetical protein [Anaerolineae bacterium]
MKKEEQAERKTISMYQTQWDVLRRLAKDMGLGSISAANRVVINEWAQMDRHQWHSRPPSKLARPNPQE